MRWVFTLWWTSDGTDNIITYFDLTLKILSAVFGAAAGEYVGTMSVNSSAKLLTSSSSLMRGLKGAATFLWDNRFQFMDC